jgi:hypothetical protein
VKFPEKLFRVWFITSEDPTFDQVSVDKTYQGKNRRFLVEATSFNSFSSKIVDGGQYLERRANWPFGSIRNPEKDNDYDVSSAEYVPLDMTDAMDRSQYDREKLLDRFFETDAEDFLLLIGDYCAGKSMTMRSIYLEKKNSTFLEKSKSFRFLSTCTTTMDKPIHRKLFIDTRNSWGMTHHII